MKKRGRKTRKLDAVLGAAATPLFLLDGRRTVIFFNAGCEQLTGWSAADVVGAVCDYASISDGAKIGSLTGRLAPPPEVLAGRETSVPTEFVRRDGKRATRMLHFFPLLDDEGHVDLVAGIAVPLREPDRAAKTSPARQLHAELAALRVALRQRFGEGTLIGRCPAMLRVLEQIRVAAASHAGVLIRGEPGSGCEHVARSIHLQSTLHTRAFVPLDCRRLPAADLKQTLNRLLESAGDAAAAGPGASLQPGTVYLANVETLPRDLQQMVVDWPHPLATTSSGEKETALRAAPRLIASTAADLEAARDGESLLADLYYRLTAIYIELPPLKDRVDDLGPLAQAFLEELNRGDERQVGGFGEEVWRLLRQYHWPGNLDELGQVIAAAREASSGETIQVEHLPFRFRTGVDAQAIGPSVEPLPQPLQELLDRFESDHIRTVLEQTRHNKTRAAHLLGMPRPKLYRRMEALGIEDREEG